MPRTKPVQLLIVDDDEIDQMAIERSFTPFRESFELICAQDGVEALGKLRNAELKPGPFIILLDLNMPRMNGLEFLKEIRNDQRLKRAVVFVLTTSNESSDKDLAFDKNVAGFFKKSNTRDLAEVASFVNQYSATVELPAHGTP